MHDISLTVNTWRTEKVRSSTETRDHAIISLHGPKCLHTSGRAHLVGGHSGHASVALCKSPCQWHEKRRSDDRNIPTYVFASLLRTNKAYHIAITDFTCPQI